MKKFWVAALAAAMLLAATACGSKDNVESTDGSGTSDTSSDALTEATEATIDPDGFDYVAADLNEYLTLGAYKGLKIPLTTSKVITDADLQTYIDNVLKQHGTSAEITDRACARGDTVVLDFSGSVDGVAFEGGTAENYTLTLGAGGFIDGFEDGIIGMTPGETKVIQAVFPANYGNEALNGKTADFEIKLHYIQETVLPEYSDAFVKETFGYDTTAAYEEYARGVLAELRELEILQEKQTAALALAVENSSVLKYPEGLVEDYVQQQIGYVQYYALMSSMSYEDFVAQALGRTVEQYEAEVRAEAEYAVKQELVVHAVAKAEDIQITEEEHAEEQAAFLEYYDYEDAASFCADYGITEAYLQKTVDFSIYYTRVLEIMLENASFVDAE